MSDIARLSGVSKPTVSRVMNGSSLVTAETRQRVLEVARENGYSVNLAARRLWQSRANTIAVVIDLPSLPEQRISQPFHFELLADVLKALNGRHQDALLIAPESETPQTYEAVIASQRADGIIFIGQGSRLGMLRDLAATNTPFVAWGAPDDAAPYCTIGSDNFQGGLLAGARFGELGKHRIAFVGGLEHREIRFRREGLEAGLRRAGASFDIQDIQPENLSYEASGAAMREFLQNGNSPPEGIFCASDTIAMAILSVLREQGVDVPRSTSVIGYDDIPQAAHHSPALTTIRQDTRLAGTLLVEKLMQYIGDESPASAMLPTALIIRES